MKIFLRTNLSPLISTMLVICFCMLTIGCNGPTKTGVEARAFVQKKYNSDLANLAAQSADEAYQVGNLDQALTNVEHAIAAEPQNPGRYILRGRIQIEMNALQNARKSFLFALKLNPDNPDAEYYLGLIFQRWSNNEDAAEHYKKAVELAPENEDYALAYVETLVALNHLEPALQFLQTTEVDVQHDPSFQRIEGHIALMQHRPKDASESFYQAMLLDPDDTGIIESLIYSYIEYGDYGHAQYYLKQLLSDPRTSDRSDLKHLMARCMSASNRLIEARDYYLQLIDHDRNDPALWYELGIVSIRLGDQRRGTQAAQTLISMWPQRAEGYILQGRLHDINNEYSKAIHDYRTAASHDADREDIFVLLGLVLEKSGDFDAAKTAYSKALSINPEGNQTKRLLNDIDERRTAAVNMD